MPANKVIFGNPLAGFSGRGVGHHRVPAPVTPVKGPAGFSALVYKCKLNVDWDGAPKAYGLERKDEGKHKFPFPNKLEPLERPANNGSLEDARADGDRHWVGVFSRNESEALGILKLHYPNFKNLKPDEQNSIFHQFLDTREGLKDVTGRFPVVQLPEMGGVANGYYVSQCNAHTGLTSNAWEQGMYVDASSVNYAARPNLPGVQLGDFGLIIRNDTGESAGFFFGDNGAGSHLGECSGAVKLELAAGLNAEDKQFTFIVFPGSGGGFTNGLTSMLMMPSVVLRQISKLRDTANQFADYLAPEGAERTYMMRSALCDWGAPGPPVVPMKLPGR